MNTNSDKRIILLVDDQAGNIQLAHNILKDTYTIKIATGGAKALILAKALPQPDLIVLDIMMPEMDGYEVCRRLKSDPGTWDIPVIFVTGKTDSEDETRGFELGAIDYIYRASSPFVVQARVRTQLKLLEARELLAEEKRKVDRLLDNILPPPAVAEIKLTGGVVPRRFENVAVLFSDLVEFTNYCDQHAPEEVVSELGDLFVAFENCVRLHGLKNQNYSRCISRDSRGVGASRRCSASGRELRPRDFRRGGPKRSRLASKIRRSHRSCHGRDRRTRAISVRSVGRHSECRFASDRSRFSWRRCSYGANLHTPSRLCNLTTWSSRAKGQRQR